MSCTGDHYQSATAHCPLEKMQIDKDKADEDLFSNIINNVCSSQHCLLPPLRSVDNLRDRGHLFSLYT